MAAKKKHPNKKQTSKKHVKKQPAKQPVVKKTVQAQPVAPAVVDVPAPSQLLTPLRSMLVVAAVVVGAVLVMAIMQMGKDVRVKDTSKGGQSSGLQVIGTDDETGALPSTGATNALQGQNNSGTTQAVPQAVQSTPGGILQASPTTPEDARGIN